MNLREPKHTTRLDARALAPRERDAAILAAFERLGIDESLELVCDQEPRSAQDVLRAAVPGHYTWVTLERSPQAWRVALTRRSRPATGSESGCCGVCGGAHLDAKA